jgi:hypothetical protein
MEEKIEKDAVCLQLYSTSTVNTLPSKLLKVWRLQNRTIATGYRRNHTTRLGIGICYGMEINVEKPKVISTSRQSSPLQIRIDENN